MWVFLFAACVFSTLTIAVPGRWVLGIFQCACFLLAFLALVRGKVSARNPVVWFTAAPALVALLQLLLGRTSNTGATIESLMGWLALLALALAACMILADELVLRRFLLSFAAFGSALSLAVLLQPYWGIQWEDMAGPFQNRNTYAGFVELAMAPVAWHALRSKGVSWIWWSAVAVMAASVVGAASRTGSVLIVLELVSILLLARWKPRGIPILAFGIVTAIWLAMAGPGHLWDRLQFDDPLGHRREIYASAIGMIRDSPLSGNGMGTFPGAYPAYATFDAGAMVNHAHNDWLEWATEGGLPLAGLMLVAAGISAAACARTTWLVGLPFVFLHALVDFPMQRAGLAAWVVILMAAAHAKEARRPPISRRVPEP
jgi:O-antigen ligase